MDKELLANRIIDYCKRQGKGHTVVCEEAGVGKDLIRNIRLGKKTELWRVADLAAHLGITTSDLIGDARASPTTSDLDGAAAALNDAGRKALLEYAAFLATKDEYKKYAQTDLGKEA